MSEGGEPASGRVALSGSVREPLPGARRVGDVDPGTPVELTIVVRRKQAAPAGPRFEPGISRAEAQARLAEAAGADSADMAAVEAFVRGHGMEVVFSDAAQRRIGVRATAAQAHAAFDVALGEYEADGISYRGREGAVHLPAEIADKVEALMGLDDRPQARMRLKRGAPLAEQELPPVEQPARAAFASRAAATPAGGTPVPVPVPLWPTQVAELYAFPREVDGSGETIGIIELGGGYRDTELAAYFAKTGVTAPSVVSVSVDGATNAPGGDADGEVLLDIEVCGAVAPGSKIVVYFSDPSDRGFYDALSTAVHDNEHAPSVISISWGGPEDAWTEQARSVFDQVLQDAAALGITVFAAAGDHGAGDASGDGRVHADLPASSPHMVACGGTTLVGVDGETVSEVVWNDGDGWATGGGISDAFPVPAWQTAVMPDNLNGSGKPGRGVPDVAGNADITSGFIVLVDGRYAPIGGTSAVAPLYAALTALLNQALGRPVGELSPKLYAIPQADRDAVFRDITDGDNSVPASEFGPATAGYGAGPGWDACTGLGSIHGQGLLQQLQAAGQALSGAGAGASAAR
jgi:kumamolisin